MSTTFQHVETRAFGGRLVSVTNSMRQASRRRRARSTGMLSPNEVRTAAKHAQIRTTASRCKATASTLKQKAAAHQSVSSQREAESLFHLTVGLPRKLGRPAFREVSNEALQAVDACLPAVPVQYTRDQLRETGLGAQMLKICSSVQASQLTGEKLPTEMSIIVQDLSCEMPSHMFAVYGRKTTTPRQRVTLYPAHAVVFATHCAHLPILPPPTASEPTPSTSGTSASLTLPVVPLCIPHPETFAPLSAFLYTKRADALMSALLPAPPTDTYDHHDTGASPRTRLAHRLARAYDAKTLLAHAMTVNGLWRNACALGVFDDALWLTMDVAWEVVLTALGIATGVPVDQLASST